MKECSSRHAEPEYGPFYCYDEDSDTDWSQSDEEEEDEDVIKYLKKYAMKTFTNILDQCQQRVCSELTPIVLMRFTVSIY